MPNLVILVKLRQLKNASKCWIGIPEGLVLGPPTFLIGTLYHYILYVTMESPNTKKFL